MRSAVAGAAGVTDGAAMSLGWLRERAIAAYSFFTRRFGTVLVAVMRCESNAGRGCRDGHGEGDHDRVRGLHGGEACHDGERDLVDDLMGDRLAIEGEVARGRGVRGHVGEADL